MKLVYENKLKDYKERSYNLNEFIFAYTLYINTFIIITNIIILIHDNNLLIYISFCSPYSIYYIAKSFYLIKFNCDKPPKKKKNITDYSIH